MTTERSGLRKQALDWLCADLDAWTKILTIDPAASGAEVPETMKHWQQDSDLKPASATKPLVANSRLRSERPSPNSGPTLRRYRRMR